MLIGRICVELKVPRFEVDSWPQTELEWWSVIFSVRDNKDKPIMADDDPYLTNYDQQRADFMRVMGFGE